MVVARVEETRWCSRRRRRACKGGGAHIKAEMHGGGASYSNPRP